MQTGDANGGVENQLKALQIKEELAACGFDWVKEIGFVHVHIFEHRVTKQPLVITVERGIVAASYVERARKICDELRRSSAPPV